MYSHDCKYGVPVRYPGAMGSGRAYALGALHVGLSAKDAVKIAAKYDSGTGGTIRSRKIKDLLK